MERIRAGVVGCGGIAQMMQLPYLRDLHDRFEVVALCDLDRATLDAVADFYGIAGRGASIEGFSDFDLDAVFVLSSGDHAGDVLWALEHGLHVFSEKPLAYTLAETDRIMDAQHRSGTVAMVGMMKQYDPGYRRGVQAVAALKDLRLVDARVMHPDDGLYRMHHRIVKGGAVTIGESIPDDQPLGRAMYDAVQARTLAGEPEALLREATGTDNPIVNCAYLFLIGSSIHDAAVLRGALGRAERVINAHTWAGGTSIAATLRYPNEVRCTYSWALLPYHKHYTQDYSFYASDGRVHIRFPSPYLRNAPTMVEVESMDGAELHIDTIVTSFDEAFRLELLHFYDCVVNRAQPLTDIAGFRADLELLTEIARSLTVEEPPAAQV